MNFSEATQYLLSLGHETLAMKLGLRNTELLLASLGNPQHAFEAVQIAGTNGKGSTAAMLDSICRAAGIRSGLYTSPHLVSIRERISLNGELISEESFASLATRVRAAAEDLQERKEIAALPTFFEQLTAIALLAFQSAGVEIAILETGLGGRLDATTVVGAKTVGITAIALDHQEYLGETLAEIAAEKAAIIHTGVTAIIAPQSDVALEVISRRCRDCGVEGIFDEWRCSELSTTTDGLLEVTFETTADRYEHVRLALRGRHQIANAALAIQLAESLRNRRFAIPQAAIVKGLETTNHPGRLSAIPGSSLLLDGAHNPAAARALRDYLDEFVKGPITLVFGAMSDKRLLEMAAVLFPDVAQLVLTRPDNPRAASVGQLAELAEQFVPKERIFVVPSVRGALDKARSLSPPDGVICVTGSLYLVGEASAVLQSTQLVG